MDGRQTFAWRSCIGKIMTKYQPQLFLVTPAFDDREEFAARLAPVLQAASVSAVLIAPRANDEASDSYQRDCKLLAPIIQQYGGAALTMNDTQVSGRSGADGIHLTGKVSEITDVMKRFRPKHIVGTSAGHTRHDAMIKGETQPDYLMFGSPFEHDEDHAYTLEMAQWWAELFEVPCVAMAGQTQDSLRATIETRSDFIGLNGFIWNHADGPEVAIKLVQEIIGSS
ncbi:MAG: thiamine phosphate synthase [Hyphomicrobiales bacterium]|nr:MAG: thiamine phosphate synthase [Hyphomicrobiales bacterium]